MIFRFVGKHPLIKERQIDVKQGLLARDGKGVLVQFSSQYLKDGSEFIMVQSLHSIHCR